MNPVMKDAVRIEASGKGGRWENASVNPATEVVVRIQTSGKVEGGRTLVCIRRRKSRYKSKRLEREEGGRTLL